MKRLIDIVLSGVFLVLVSPFLVFAFVGIKLTSPGPVFYTAQRVGKGGAPFSMYKFRTMNVAPKDDAGAVITSFGDPRIFKFGALLRKTKIDELPQFLNVLNGDMSVVGPRPEDPKIVTDHYTDWMMETLDVRPGLTSPGAVFYYACGEELIDTADPEGSYVEKLLPLKLAIERGYLARDTVLRDFAVMVRTALAIVREAIGRPLRANADDIAAASDWVDPAAFEAFK